MATWEAEIKEVSSIDANCTVTVKFDVLRDDKVQVEGLSLTCQPTDATTEVKSKALDIAQAWEVANGIVVGERILVAEDGEVVEAVDVER